MIGLFVLVWALLLGQPTAWGARWRTLFVRLATPFERLGDLIPVLHSHHELARENARLQGENTDLRKQIEELGHLRAENQQFHNLLNLKNAAPWHTVGARVIGRDAANWWQSIQLDRGSDDGLRPNLPVLSASGLVGKTIAVTRGESRVLLLIDPACKAGALIQRSRDLGIAGGVTAALRREPRLQMTFVDRTSTVQVGDVVYTSGLGGVFPRGILIGTVTDADLDPQAGMYQNIEIKPAADFRRLEEVMVIVE